MSTKTNHFNSINRRVLYLTDKIAWCIVNDKPYNLYLHEREALIWATDKIKELSSRLFMITTKPDNLTPEQELIYLRSRVESLEFDKSRLSNDLFKERAKKSELTKKLKGNQQQ